MLSIMSPSSSRPSCGSTTARAPGASSPCRPTRARTSGSAARCPRVRLLQGRGDRRRHRRWQTSVFPDNESEGFVLPVKKAVRRAEAIDVGDVVLGRAVDRLEVGILSAMTSSFFDQLATSVLDGKPATEDDALAVLRAHDDELIDRRRRRRPAAPRALRQHGQGQLPGQPQVRPVPRELQLLLAGARLERRHPQVHLADDRRGARAGGGRARGRRHPGLHGLQRPRPDRPDVERVADMVGAIKAEHPDVEVCACLGLLKDGQAERLREAGVDAYNHNINTAESHHDQIVRPTRTPTASTPSSKAKTRRALAVLRPDRGPRRDRRAAGRGAVRAQRARAPTRSRSTS